VLSPVKVSKPRVQLEPSEQTITQAAATLLAAYIVSGKMKDGEERHFLERSVREAIQMARLVDACVAADSEVG
jgi:hypothetical protein